jgi:uncharacterized protein (DUF1778 family)
MVREGIMATEIRATKEKKVQLRLQESQKRVIARAAEMRQTTLTHFMIEHAYQAAQTVLAEQVHFTLSPDQWDAFCEALDAPPRSIPALSKLLNEPSVFDVAAEPTRTA